MAHGRPPSAALRQRLQALFLAATKQSDAGRWADAISLFQEIVLDSNSPAAHCNLGVTYMRSGRLAEAAASLQRAVELRPGYFSALSHLAHLREQGGGEPEALLADRRLSRTADDPLERRRYSAKALAMEGKLEEAEKELRSLLSLSRQSWLRQEFFLGGCCRTARCSRRLRIT